MPRPTYMILMAMVSATYWWVNLDRAPTAGETTSKSSLANARLRVYLNEGSNATPRYDGFEYLQAGGENASVPST